MSRLSRDVLNRCIHDVVEGSKLCTLGFMELVTVQVTLKSHDPRRWRHFGGTEESAYRVCVLGDQQHCDEAFRLKIPCMSLTQLQEMKKDKKMVKRLARQYDGFLASSEVLQQLPLLFGPALDKAGKTPTLLTHEEPMEPKVEEIKEQVKTQMNKLICLSMEVGHVEMPESELAANVIWSVDFLVNMLRNSWENIQELSIKSSTGIQYTLH